MAMVTVEEMAESINVILDETRLPLTRRRLRAARNYIENAQAHSDGQAAALQSELSERDAESATLRAENAEMLKVTGPKCPKCGHFAIEHEVRENTMRRARQFCKRCACDTDPLERWTEVKDGE